MNLELKPFAHNIMTVLAKNIKRHLPKLGVLLLLLSFGVMTGFSTVLHAHELDLSSAHDDCFSCHWSQSNHSDESDTPWIEAPSIFQSFQLISAEGIDKQLIGKLFNRGPPALS
jgi:hypothetical protein